MQKPSSNLQQRRFITISDLEEVFAASFKAQNEWQSVLLALGVSSATIESIRVRCHDNPEDCYHKGLAGWLKGGERSWGDLVEALSASIAKMIERGQTSGTTSDPDSQQCKLMVTC